jgi:hypothetical protein
MARMSSNLSSFLAGQDDAARMLAAKVRPGCAARGAGGA